MLCQALAGLHVRELTSTNLVRSTTKQTLKVGFDVADIQICLDYVEPSLAHRIRWVHGNMYVTNTFLLGSVRSTDGVPNSQAGTSAFCGQLI